jgi:selenocysteine lyase/cysteine desulfurase
MMKLGLFKDLLMLPGAVRTSFAFYNTIDEAYKTAQAIREILN